MNGRNDAEGRAIAARWIEMLEGNQFLVPGPPIKRAEMLAVARAALSAYELESYLKEAKEWEEAALSCIGSALHRLQELGDKTFSFEIPTPPKKKDLLGQDVIGRASQSATAPNARAVAEKCAEICDGIAAQVGRSGAGGADDRRPTVERCAELIRAYAASLPSLQPESAAQKVPEGWVLLRTECLRDLCAYGRIHTVESVSYGRGRSHHERINEAQEALWAAATPSPSNEEQR